MSANEHVALSDAWADTLTRIAYLAAQQHADANHLPAHMVEDLTQEGVTWLLEAPGRVWVRDWTGEPETPLETTIRDVRAHYRREMPWTVQG